MAKKEKNILLFTIGEGAKAKQVERKEYVSHMEGVAGKNKELKGIKFGASHINKLLDLAIAGDEPNEETPEAVQDFFKVIAGDYEKAKEAFDDREAEAKKEAEEAEKALKEKESEEKALIEFVSDVQADNDALKGFMDKFDLGGGTQCVPKGEVELKDWVGALAFGIGLETGSQWIIADAVVALEDAGHENVVIQIAGQFKKSYSTISGMARTARAFPVGKRNPAVPFQAHREIGNAAFDAKPDKVEKLREKLLSTAAKEQLSSQEVRSHVRKAQGKEDIAPAAALKYLVLNTKNISNSELVSELPKSIEEHQLVIDMSKKVYLVEEEKDGKTEVAWIEFAKGK